MHVCIVSHWKDLQQWDAQSVLYVSCVPALSFQSGLNVIISVTVTWSPIIVLLNGFLGKLAQLCSMVYTDGKCACIVFMLNECTYGRASLGRKVHSNDNFPCNFGLLEKCSIRKDGVFCVMWNFYSFFFFFYSQFIKKYIFH